MFHGKAPLKAPTLKLYAQYQSRSISPSNENEDRNRLQKFLLVQTKSPHL